MFVTLVHIHVKPEDLEEFEDATRASHEASIRERGNVRFDVLRSVEDPTRYIVYEWNVDEDAAKAHKATAHYDAWQDAGADRLAEPRYGVRYTSLFLETPGVE